MNELAINVYSFDKKEIVAIRLSNNDFLNQINLLMMPCTVHDEYEMEIDEILIKPTHHYVLIKNVPGLLNKEQTNR